MRVLFVSGELIAGDLAYRLRLEGCDVRLFVEHSGQKRCLDGFVEKTDDWKSELSWVGKDGLIVFDDIGYGKEQDELRKQGYRVFGGSAGGERLECDREFAQDTFASLGITVEKTINFSSPRIAAEHVRKYPAAYVIKQNDHISANNYVGEFPDGKDVLSVLERYDRSGIRNISLQKVIQGIELAVGRFFNGSDWVGPISVNLEHKSLFPGNIGPKTGEMGTVLWFDENEQNRLFQRVLQPLQAYLVSVGYRGHIDVNCIVNERDAYPIDVTTRFGCPTMHLQGDLMLSSISEFLTAVASGQAHILQCRNDIGVVLTFALPPFPYNGVAEEYLSDDLEIFFRGEMNEEEQKRIHFEGVRRVCENGSERLFVTKSIGYTMFITGYGGSVYDARESAYALIRRIVVPKAFYRIDIGEEFMRSQREILIKWKWI
jgi:phosphoribosylamine--glycine ligase